MANFSFDLWCTSPSDATIEVWDGSYTKTPNVSAVGGPVPSTGIANNFAANTRYIQPSSVLSLGSNPWRLKVRFTTGSNVSATQYIFIKEFWFDLYIVNGRLQTDVGNDSTWQQTYQRGSKALTTNTTYDVIYEYTGSAHNVYFVENGVETLDITVANSTAHADTNLYMGWGPANGVTLTAFYGSIDLNYCSFESNGKVLWTGMTQTKNIQSATGHISIPFDTQTTFEYKVFKSGYKTVTGRVIAVSDWGRYVELRKDPLLNRILNNTLVNRVYLGNIMVHGVPVPENWVISSDGTSITRTAFPYTMEPYSSDRISLTANSELFFENLGLGNSPTGSIDNTPLDLINSDYRDCLVIPVSNNTSASTKNIILEYASSDTGADSYIQLNKDGTAKEIVETWHAYQPTVPVNAFVYDSVNDTITIAAGVWDASIMSNTPVTLSEPIVLTNQGGTSYADSNFDYYLSFYTPLQMLQLKPSATYNDHATARQSGTSRTYCMYPKSNASTDGIQITSTEQNIGSRLFISGSTSSVSGSFVTSTSTYLEFKYYVTSSLKDVVSDKFTYTYGGLNMSAAKTQSTHKFIYNDNTEETILAEGSGSRSAAITLEQIRNLKAVHIIGRGQQSAYTVSAPQQIFNANINGTWGGGSYSVPINAETRQDWMDPTQGKLEIGYGVFTGYYANINGTLESITTTPTYEVIEQ